MGETEIRPARLRSPTYTGGAIADQDSLVLLAQKSWLGHVWATSHPFREKSSDSPSMSNYWRGNYHGFLGKSH